MTRKNTNVLVSEYRSGHVSVQESFPDYSNTGLTIYSKLNCNGHERIELVLTPEMIEGIRLMLQRRRSRLRKKKS